MVSLRKKVLNSWLLLFVVSVPFLKNIFLNEIAGLVKRIYCSMLLYLEFKLVVSADLFRVRVRVHVFVSSLNLCTCESKR